MVDPAIQVPVTINLWHLEGLGTMSATRFRSRGRGISFILTFLTVLVAMDLWFMITAAPKHNGVLAVVIGAVFLLILLPMLIFSMSFLRCVTLTDTELRVPRYYKTLVMPTVEIAGVGLLYHKEKYGRRARSGWFVYAWRVDGSKEKLAPLFYNPGKFGSSGIDVGDRREPLRQEPLRETPGECRQGW